MELLILRAVVSNCQPGVQVILDLIRKPAALTLFKCKRSDARTGGSAHRMNSYEQAHRIKHRSCGYTPWQSGCLRPFSWPYVLILICYTHVITYQVILCDKTVIVLHNVLAVDVMCVYKYILHCSALHNPTSDLVTRLHCTISH